MIEGDLIAGELDVPIDWLETLARKEQAKYIEPGLWIAAEHEQEYTAALNDGDTDARMHLVRRSLRYHGAQSSDQVGERYLWPEDSAHGILSALCRMESVVENDGLYYHAELYDRARRETVKNRRKQIRTLPPERYAALLSRRISMTALPEEKLGAALKMLCGQPVSPVLWESVLLPARVSGYRPEMLDKLLAQGNVFWRITSDLGLSFHMYEDIDWDADLSETGEALEGDDKIIYDALLKRGASFMQRLSGLLDRVSPLDTLLKLAEEGLVCADSFVPVRQWMNQSKTSDKPDKGAAKQRVKSRVMAMTSGRWELLRPLKQQTREQLLERIFDRSVIICRETVQGLTWASALEVLRVWEYTGQVRRGYFIEGMSGIQFIREKDFAATMLALEQPQAEIVWLPAVDPAQQWGKSLPHMVDRSFLNVPGTVVALQAGLPTALFERHGKVFRIFDNASLPEALRIFIQDYSRRRIYPTHNRLTVTQYPPEAVDALIKAGFKREMQDFVLYRG